MKYDFETLVNRSDKYSRKWQMMDEEIKDIDPNIPPFSVADYDFKYPDKLINTFKDYIDEMIFGYTGPTKEYYESFINWVQRRHNFTIKPEWIISGNGVVSGIDNSIKIFSKKGDGVIIMTPVYPPFARTVNLAKRKLIECELINQDGLFTIDFDLLEKQSSDKNNKILVLCSPHNPVGRVWLKEEISKIAEICTKHDVLVISDEIHMDILLDDHKHTVYGSVSKQALVNSVLLTSASKSFNLAGARNSFVVIADREKRETYNKYVKDNWLTGFNSFGFKLTEIAYNDCEDWFDEFLEVINKNYRLMKAFIETNLPMIKVTPLEGTYLLWLDMRALRLNDDQLHDFMVNGCNIFVDKGSFFGEVGSGFIRINTAYPTWVIEAALNRLKTCVDKLVE